jgi:hypothetical protein
MNIFVSVLFISINLEMNNTQSISAFTNNKFVIQGIDEYNSSYNPIYQLAIAQNGKAITNNSLCFFSRIEKKNGKHRYYLTRVEYQQQLDNGSYNTFYNFQSIYLGKNIELAYQEFLEDYDSSLEDIEEESTPILSNPFILRNICRKRLPYKNINNICIA